MKAHGLPVEAGGDPRVVQWSFRDTSVPHPGPC